MSISIYSRTFKIILIKEMEFNNHVFSSTQLKIKHCFNLAYKHVLKYLLNLNHRNHSMCKNGVCCNINCVKDDNCKRLKGAKFLLQPEKCY